MAWLAQLSSAFSLRAKLRPPTSLVHHWPSRHKQLRQSLHTSQEQRLLGRRSPCQIAATKRKLIVCGGPAAAVVQSVAVLISDVLSRLFARDLHSSVDKRRLTLSDTALFCSSAYLPCLCCAPLTCVSNAAESVSVYRRFRSSCRQCSLLGVQIHTRPDRQHWLPNRSARQNAVCITTLNARSSFGSCKVEQARACCLPFRFIHCVTAEYLQFPDLCGRHGLTRRRFHVRSTPLCIVAKYAACCAGNTVCSCSVTVKPGILIRAGQLCW